MAHIILKTSKAQKQATFLSNQNVQPFVIDFSKTYQPARSNQLLFIGLGIVSTFFIASVIALFILAEQINGLWREAINRDSTVLVNSKNDPESAFPALTLTPLPSKALIIGRDFQRTNSPTKRELTAMLEPLPLAKGLSSRPSGGAKIEVETVSGISQSTSLQVQADEAVSTGEIEKAITLYTKALRHNPDDASLRSNTVALLLEQARFHDEQEEAQEALDSYKKALALWKGQSETAQSIRARIAYLENKIRDYPELPAQD